MAAPREIVTTGAALASALTEIQTAALDGAAALAGLPQPAAIAELDFEAYKVEARTRYADLVEAETGERPDTLDLAATPEAMLIEALSYRELLLRKLVNESYRSRLLYFATGADLDQVAEEYGVERLEDEPDADLRRRTRLHNRGSSAAGPAEWWRAHAMTADELVEDVAVTRDRYGDPAAPRGAITLSVLAEGLTGEPSAETLAAVDAVAQSAAVRPAGVSVTVRAATRSAVDIAAAVTLAPGADPAIADALPARLAASWAAARRIGWPVVESWVLAALHAPGVAKIELTGWEDVATAPDEAPLLGEIALSVTQPAAGGA